MSTPGPLYVCHDGRLRSPVPMAEIQRNPPPRLLAEWNRSFLPMSQRIDNALRTMRRNLLVMRQGKGNRAWRRLTDMRKAESRRVYFWPPDFREEDCSGVFDGFTVTSDADPGL